MSNSSLSYSLSLLHVFKLEVNSETTEPREEDLRRSSPPLIEVDRSSNSPKASDAPYHDIGAFSQAKVVIKTLQSQTQKSSPHLSQRVRIPDTSNTGPYATRRRGTFSKAHQYWPIWPQARGVLQLDGIDNRPQEPAQQAASDTIPSTKDAQDEAATSSEDSDVEAATQESGIQRQTRGGQSPGGSRAGSYEGQAKAVAAGGQNGELVEAKHEETLAPAQSEEIYHLSRPCETVQRGDSDDSTLTMATVRRVKSMSSSLVPLKSALVPPTRHRSPTEIEYFQQRGTRKCARFLIGPDDSEMSLRRSNTAPAAVTFSDSDTWLPPPLMGSPDNSIDTSDSAPSYNDEDEDEDDDATSFDVNSYMARNWSLAATAKSTDLSEVSDTDSLTGQSSGELEAMARLSSSRSTSPVHESLRSNHRESNVTVLDLSNLRSTIPTDAIRRFSDPHPHFLSAVESAEHGSPSTYLQPPETPRAASMSEYTQRRGRMKTPGSLLLCSKARAVEPAVTACSVIVSEPLRPNPVYDHPGAKYKQRTPEQRPAQTAQTVRTSTSMMHIVWSEPERCGSECSDVSVVDEGNRSVGVAYPESLAPESSGAVTPMTKVKSKLAAWSWAKHHQSEDSEGHPKWLPLLSWHHGGQASSRNASSGRLSSKRPLTPDAAMPPPPPPNTRGPSGASSMRPSGAQTPMTLHTESQSSDEESEPVELRVRKRLSFLALDSAPARSQLVIPLVRAKTSPNSPLLRSHHPEHRDPTSCITAVAAEHQPFQNHRDSVDLSRRRFEELKQQELDAQRSLARTRDSIAIARTRLQQASGRGPAPRSPPIPIPTVPTRNHPEVVAHWPSMRSSHLLQSDNRSAWQRTSLACLSPILDASPPDDSLASGLVERLKEVARGTDESSGGASPAAWETRNSELGEHSGCAICETDRPRWFEAYKRGLAIEV